MNTDWDNTITPNTPLAHKHNLSYTALRKVLYMCVVDALDDLQIRITNEKPVSLHAVSDFVLEWLEKNPEVWRDG